MKLSIIVVSPIDYLGVEIARPEDIAAMKIAAIMDRGTTKISFPY